MPGLIMTVGTAWKRALYLGFLFLLVALKQRIVAAPPSSPTSVLGGGGALLTQRSKVILWPAFPGQVCGQACQVVRISVCVCCLCAQVCAHTYPGRLNSHCWKPFCQLQHILPFIDGSQNARSYFNIPILKMVTRDTQIIAVDTNSRTQNRLHNLLLKLWYLYVFVMLVWSL